MTDYRAALIKLIDQLSSNAVKRIYQLAEYLYIHKEKGGAA